MRLLAPQTQMRAYQTWIIAASKKNKNHCYQLTLH
jgi:hypothetical protein